MPFQNIGFIFLHGFMGRAETKIGGLTLEYFRGLRKIAAETGIEMAVPQMSGRTGVEARADGVRKTVDSMKAARIALVGVSMGGLVARAFALRHDPGGRISTVATVATPHRGSPLADRALSDESDLPAVIVNIFRDAVQDLTAVNTNEFNTRTPDREDVRYLSWACTRPADEMPFWLRGRQRLIFEREGANDGLVSVKSATWGELVATERADHFESIGWSPKFSDKKINRPFDQQALWRRIIEMCRAP